MRVAERIEPRGFINTVLPPEETRHFFIYRVGGETDDVAPATGIYITLDRVYILLGEAPVATYHRDEVYFVARELVPAPPVG